jgi:hypothetical protein
MRATWIGMVSVLLVGGATAARADVNRTPMAVPLIGTQGAAGPYPTTINVVAPGGPGYASPVNVRLWGVTHPCPRDLAILLVHNNAGYLLMSHAGGCRPMQGTNLRFLSLAPTMIAENPAVSPPSGEFADVRPSNYGPQPVFPAPAPAGPYTDGLPSWDDSINGSWSLYVIDTQSEHRGVVAGGWSLEYSTRPEFPAAHEDVAVPASGTGPGNAEFYPLTFDLTQVP